MPYLRASSISPRLTCWTVLIIAIVLLAPADAQQEAKLVADDRRLGTFFGSSVAVSDQTALVGAYRDDDNGGYSGAAYVFVRSGEAWAQQAKLVAADGQPSDNFGVSVAVSGETAVIGAYADDGGRGSAYVFVRSGGTWVQQAKLTASDRQPGDLFGVSVAVSGETVVVGAYLDDDSGSGSGSAYVFVRTGEAWAQQAKLVAADSQPSDGFGFSVASSGDTAVVGASGDDDRSGSAYVFGRSGETWDLQAKLTPEDRQVGSFFGGSVSISGDAAVVGAYGGDGIRGSAYVFVQSDGAWAQQAELTAADGESLDRFGSSVAVSGEVVAVGAPGDDDTGSESGSVYVFVRSDAAWVQQDKLVATDSEPLARFGQSVAISGEKAVVGAYGDDDAVGSAYVFGLTGATAGELGAENAFALAAPRPNPVTTRTGVPFELATTGPVRIAIYDALGREVALLVDGDRTAGEHYVVLDTSRLASGAYIVRLTASGNVLTRTFSVVR